MTTYLYSEVFLSSVHSKTNIVSYIFFIDIQMIEVMQAKL